MPRSSIRRLCVYILSIVAVVGSGAVSAIQPPVLSVYAKRLNSTGALQSVEPGATLVTGDAISIRVRSAERAYVYVIAVGASGSAVMLQPFSEQPDDALMPAQMRRTIPGNGAVLPLDRHVGNETLIAVATPTPFRDPRAMLLEIESRAARGGILDAQALADFGEVAVFAFRHVPGAEILSEKQPARPVLFANSATESGVLSGAGSRIRALLDGIPPQRVAPVNVPAVPSAPPVPSAPATPIAVERAAPGPTRVAEPTPQPGETARLAVQVGAPVPQLEARRSRLPASASKPVVPVAVKPSLPPAAVEVGNADRQSDSLANRAAGDSPGRTSTANVPSVPTTSAPVVETTLTQTRAQPAAQSRPGWLSNLFGSSDTPSTAIVDTTVNNPANRSTPVVVAQESATAVEQPASEAAAVASPLEPATQAVPEPSVGASVPQVSGESTVSGEGNESGGSWFSSLFGSASSEEPSTTSSVDVGSAVSTPTSKDNSNIDQPARAQALNVAPAEPTQAFAPPAPVTPGVVRNPPAPPVRPAPVITRPPPPRNEISKASAETGATSTGTTRAAVARPVQTPAPRVTSQVRQAATPEPVLSESLTSEPVLPDSVPPAPAVAASPPPAPTSGVTVAVPATSAPVVVTPPAPREAPVAQAVGGVLGALASFFAPTASEDEEATQESAANENTDISSPAGDNSDAPLVASSADEERAQMNSGATASPSGVVKDTADDGAFLSFDRIPERVVTPASTSPSVSSTTEPRRADPPVRRLSVVSQGAPEPTPSKPVRVAPTPNKVEQPESTVSQPLVVEPITTASTTVTPPVTPAPSAAVPRNQAPESSAAPQLAVREVTAPQAEPRDVGATQLPAADEGGGFLAQLANIFGGSDTQAESDNASAAEVPGTRGLSTAADAPKPASVTVVESAPVLAPQLPRVPPPLAPASDDIKVKLPQIASGPITVRTADSSTPPAASAESPPESSGVLSAAGSRIAAMLGFGSSSDSDDEPAPTEAPSQAAETVPATDSPAIAQPLLTRESGTPEQEGGERPLPEPSSQLSDTDSSNRGLAADTPDPVRAGAGASADDVAASRPEPEPARVVASAAQPMVVVPAAVPSPESVVAAIPERPAISVAPARPALAPLALTPQQALVELDPTADNGASAAMMLVVTPAATGSALLVDDEGHLLTTWHLVKGFSRVTVWPKAPGQALPDTATPMLARVVRANRNSDLALLVIDGDLPDVEPLELAEEAALKRGEVVHVLGHTNGDRWTHVMARHVRRKARHSWITQGRFVHRESVLSNQAVGAPDTTGGAVFNGRMQLVGLNVQIGRKSGQLYSVAVDRIRRFLSGELATDPSPSG